MSHPMAPALKSFVLGVIIVAALAPFGVWAVGFAKRQRGVAAVATGLLLVFGIGVPILPPPPPVAEQVREDEDDGE